MNLNIDKLREACKSSFPAFIRYLAGDDVDDSGNFWLDKFHYDLAEWMQKPRRYEKAVILARGFLKTTVVTQYYAIWRAVRNPNIRIMIVSSSALNAFQKLELIRSTFDRNPKFRLLFGYLVPEKKTTRWSNQCIQINRTQSFPEGTFEGAGTGTQVTGRHFDLIIEDDTGAPDISEYGADQVLPPTIETIEKAINWHKQSIPLLISPATSERIVVGTRWTYYDLMYHIKEHEKSFEFFDLSAIVDEKPTYARFPLDVLEKIKGSMSDYLYFSLYLNEPLPADTMAFHPDQIVYIDKPVEDGTVVITVDSAGWKGKGDSSAIVAASHSRGYIDVLDSFIDRVQPDKVVGKIFEFSKRYNSRRVIVETDANQYMYAKHIRDECIRQKKLIGVEEIQTGGKSKELRIMGMQPLFQNRQIRFINTIGNKKLISQIVQYPYGSGRDGPDALAYHVKVYKGIVSPQSEKKFDREYKFEVRGEDVCAEIHRWKDSTSFGMRSPVGVYFGRN